MGLRSGACPKSPASLRDAFAPCRLSPESTERLARERRPSWEHVARRNSKDGNSPAQFDASAKRYDAATSGWMPSRSACTVKHQPSGPPAQATPPTFVEAGGGLEDRRSHVTGGACWWATWPKPLAYCFAQRTSAQAARPTGVGVELLRLRPTRDSTRAGGFTPRSTRRTLLACIDIALGQARVGPASDAQCRGRLPRDRGITDRTTRNVARCWRGASSPCGWSRFTQGGETYATPSTHNAGTTA